MKTHLLNASLITATALAVVTPASATLIAYEGFDYTAGTTISASLNGGTGWSNAWTSQTPQNGTNWAANATGLTYTDGTNTLTVAGGSMLDSTGSGDGNRWRRNFAIPGGAWGTSSTWFSFLTDRTDSSTGTTQTWNFRLQQDGTTIAQIRNINGATDGWELADSANAQQAATSGLSEIAPVFVLGRVTHGVGNDLLEIWFNPNLASPGPSSISATFTNFSALNGFSFETGSTTTGRIDEIRFGTTFASVSPIPEPSTYAAIAGFAALGLVTLRRRKS